MDAQRQELQEIVSKLMEIHTLMATLRLKITAEVCQCTNGSLSARACTRRCCTRYGFTLAVRKCLCGGFVSPGQWEAGLWHNPILHFSSCQSASARILGARDGNPFRPGFGSVVRSSSSSEGCSATPRPGLISGILGAARYEISSTNTGWSSVYIARYEAHKE